MELSAVISVYPLCVGAASGFGFPLGGILDRARNGASAVSTGAVTRYWSNMWLHSLWLRCLLQQGRTNCRNKTTDFFLQPYEKCRMK